MAAVAIELDGVLGDTRPLYDAWLEDVSRRAHVDPERLDEELPNWRVLLERFAEDHAPVYLRPSAPATAALRRLQARGRPGRRLHRRARGAGADRRRPPRRRPADRGARSGAGRARARCCALLGPDTQVVRSLADLPT